MQINIDKTVYIDDITFIPMCRITIDVPLKLTGESYYKQNLDTIYKQVTKCLNEENQ